MPYSKTQRQKEELLKRAKEESLKTEEKQENTYYYYSVTCARCGRQLYSEPNKRQETYGCECGAITDAGGNLFPIPDFKEWFSITCSSCKTKLLFSNRNQFYFCSLCGATTKADGSSAADPTVDNNEFIYPAKFADNLKSLNAKQGLRCPFCNLAASGMLPYDYFYCSDCEMFIKLLPEMNNKDFESLSVADYGSLLVAKFEAAQQGEAKNKNKDDSNVVLWLCVNCRGRVKLLKPRYGAVCTTCNTYYDSRRSPISYNEWSEKERKRLFGPNKITRRQEELAQITRMKEREVVITPSIYALTRNLTKEEVALIRKVIEEGESEIERTSNLILKPQATPEREVIRRRIILDDTE